MAAAAAMHPLNQNQLLMSRRKKILKRIGYAVLGIAVILILTAFMIMRPVKPSLKTGDSAPQVALSDINGQSFSYNDFSKDQKVLLAFFRFAGCPVCNVRVHELSNAYESLKKEGVEIVAVFESSPQVLKAYQQDFEFPFRIISDVDGQLYKSYGVKKKLGNVIRTLGNEQAVSRFKQGESLYGDRAYEQDGSFTRMTAEFVIKNGKIERAHYGRHLADHLDLSTL